MHLVPNMTHTIGGNLCDSNKSHKKTSNLDQFNNLTKLVFNFVQNFDILQSDKSEEASDV